MASVKIWTQDHTHTHDVQTLTGLVVPPPITSVGGSVTLHLSALSTRIAKAALACAAEFYSSKSSYHNNCQDLSLTSARGIIL